MLSRKGMVWEEDEAVPLVEQPSRQNAKSKNPEKATANLSNFILE